MGVLVMLSSGRGALAEAGLTIDVSKLPVSWSMAQCRSVKVDGGPGAFVLLGKPRAPNRWTGLVLATAETAPADREVSESEERNSTNIDVGSNRRRARLQVAMGVAMVDWWDGGLQVGIVAAGSDRSAAVSLARRITVSSDGATVKLRASPVPPRVLIARGVEPGSARQRLTCDTGPGGRTLTVESGDGVDPGAPPIVVGDELIRFAVGPYPAWRTTRTVKLAVQGGDLNVTTCVLTVKLSSRTRATLLGTAPCDGLVADAAVLPAALS